MQQRQFFSQRIHCIVVELIAIILQIHFSRGCLVSQEKNLDYKLKVIYMINKKIYSTLYILDQEKESSRADTGSGNIEEANEAGATGLPTDTVVTDEPGEGVQEIELPSIGKTILILVHSYFMDTYMYVQF